VNFTVISSSYSPGIQGKAILLKTQWFIYYWANTPVRLRDISCTIVNIQKIYIRYVLTHAEYDRSASRI
jgi:mRNA-degrading endonuclease HigB of HigAB toxin-antitoxin module